MGKVKGNNIQQGEVEIADELLFNLNSIDKATKLKAHLAAPALGIENNYDIWGHPEIIKSNESSHIIIATEASAEL